MKKLVAATVVCVGILLGTSSVLAFAAGATPSAAGVGQALEIAPPILTLSANPGQTIKAQVELRDISGGKLLVSNQINDFVAAGENGVPKILTGNDKNDPFSLKNWISPLPSFILSPEQIRTLDLYIKVPTNAAPGGHFGVIRFTGTPPSLQKSGVSLSASLGALVLLTVNGKLNDHLALNQFSVSSGTSGSGSFFESTPLNFIVKTKNSGNVQEQPTGHIFITDMFHKPVAEVNVNIPPHDVLPDSIRKFTGALGSTELGNKHLFGLYHATLQLSYGVASHKTLTSTVSFWVIPYRLIIGIVVFLIIVFFVLRYLIRHYNRLIITKAQQNSQNGVAAGKKKSQPDSKTAEEPERVSADKTIENEEGKISEPIDTSESEESQQNTGEPGALKQTDSETEEQEQLSEDKTEAPKPDKSDEEK